MKKVNKNIHLLIAVILFIVLKLLLNSCTGMGITTIGASVLALFISTVYLWITYGSSWTSMFSIGLLAFTGIAPAATVLGSSFGNSTTVICIGTLIMCLALEDNGVTQKIANWFITLKIVNKRPYTFLFMFLLANMVVCYFMEATAIMILFMSLAKGILDSLEYTREDKFSKCLFLGILWVTCAGGGATPIGHPVSLLMINALQNVLEINVPWGKYMLVGIPLSFVVLLLSMLIFRFIIKPDCSKYDKYDAAARKAEEKPLTKKGRASLIIYLILIVVWLIPEITSSWLPAVSSFFSNAGAAAAALVAAAITCAIPIDGKPILDYQTALKKIHWSTIIFIACIFVYASTFSMETGGINVFLKSLVSPLATTLSPEALVAVFLFFVIIATNFVSNGVTGIIGITVCAPALLGVTDTAFTMAYGILVGILCFMGIATPGGSGFVALGQKDGYITGGETFKYSMILILVLYVVTMLVFWPLAKAVC